MPTDILTPGKPGNKWNFGPGALTTYRGWQYAAYWDAARQVSVARRQLPDGPWAVVSLPGYQRSETGNRGFGDGHEKVSLGVSPDGVIHLAFDHHVDTLHYRVTRPGAANAPASHAWDANLFGPVRDSLGGPTIKGVTYPAFLTDGADFSLYLRTGGSGGGDSHFFEYVSGRWQINSARAGQFIDRKWSGGDRQLNAYPQGMVIHKGRRHLTWCWRDTPLKTTNHDLCYAYSDDNGKTWHAGDGTRIATRGTKFITADTPGVTVWKIPPGTAYINGGSMTVDNDGRVHVLVKSEDGSPAHFQRDPRTGKWTRQRSAVLGTLVPGKGDSLYIVSGTGLMRTSARNFGRMEAVASGHGALLKDSSPGVDVARIRQDGVISVIGQSGKTVTVIDYPVESR
jgi:ribosomal protein L24E